MAGVAALGLMVALAHSGFSDEHVGEAAAMCFAVAASTAMAIAATPRVGRLVPGPCRPRSWDPPARGGGPIRVADARARGHPAVLQVFRR
jgi:hypothetical protein